MTATEAEVATAAMELSPMARAELAKRLMDSLDAAAQNATVEEGVTEKFPFVPREKRVPFWRQPQSEAVDLVCDWILANHSAMREESVDCGVSL